MDEEESIKYNWMARMGDWTTEGVPLVSIYQLGSAGEYLSNSNVDPQALRRSYVATITRHHHLLQVIIFYFFKIIHSLSVLPLLVVFFCVLEKPLIFFFWKSFLFLRRVNGIEFEEVRIDLAKGQHRLSQFKGNYSCVEG